MFLFYRYTQKGCFAFTARILFIVRQQRQPPAPKLVSIPFYFHLSSLLFCHAPLFSFALDFSLRSAWKGFMRITVMASAWDVFSIFNIFFSPFPLSTAKGRAKKCRSSHTHATKGKGSKSVGRLQENIRTIYEQFMHLLHVVLCLRADELSWPFPMLCLL